MLQADRRTIPTALLIGGLVSTAAWYYCWSKGIWAVVCYAVVVFMGLLVLWKGAVWLMTRGTDPIEIADRSGKLKAVTSDQQLVLIAAAILAAGITVAAPVLFFVMALVFVVRRLPLPWWVPAAVALVTTPIAIFCVLSSPDKSFFAELFGNVWQAASQGGRPFTTLSMLMASAVAWSIPAGILQTFKRWRQVREEHEAQVKQIEYSEQALQSLTRDAVHSAPSDLPPHLRWQEAFLPLGEALDINTGQPLGRLDGLFGAELRTHGAVLGMTGSGKTVFFTRLIRQALEAGFDVTVIDLKEDAEKDGLEEFLELECRRLGLKYQSWGLGYDADEFLYYLNPLDGLDLDSAKNAITALQEWDDGHWQALGKQRLADLLIFLTVSSRLRPDVWEPATLFEIGRYLSEIGTGAIDEIVASIRGRKGAKPLDVILQQVPPGSIQAEVIRRYKAIMAASDDQLRAVGVPDPVMLRDPQSSRGMVYNLFMLDAQEKQAASGLGQRITNAFTSETYINGGYSPTTPNSPVRRYPLDLIGSNVVYLGLSVQRQTDTAKAMASAVLQRYIAECGNRQSFSSRPELRPRLILIDESSKVDIGIIAEGLARCRSAGYFFIFSTQQTTDWGPEGWLSVVGNINWVASLRQTNPQARIDTAEYIGKEIRQFTTRSISSDQTAFGYEWAGGVRESYSTREAEDYRVSPELFQRLPTGQVIITITDAPMRKEYVEQTAAEGMGYVTRIAIKRPQVVSDGDTRAARHTAKRVNRGLQLPEFPQPDLDPTQPVVPNSPPGGLPSSPPLPSTPPPPPPAAPGGPIPFPTPPPHHGGGQPRPPFPPAPQQNQPPFPPPPPSTPPNQW